MGLYKICEHKGRMRDRCEHAWWGSFRGIRVSLPKWANRDIHSKAEAQAVLDEVRTAIREGTFDVRGQAPQEVSPTTFREFADIYKERHAVARKLSLARTIDWRIRPILERFGDWALTDIKTADLEDFIADLPKPRQVGKRAEERCLTPASINRTIELLRHMLNWAVGREYLEKTPFRRGTETLIKKLREDNQRRRRLRIDAEGKQKSDETLVFSNEIGEPLPHFHDAWLRTVLKAHGIRPRWTARLKHKGLSSESKDAFRKINLRWHDLRHEYASRLVERGVPLAQVRDLLGHASIMTTEHYDNQKLENLEIAAAKLESGLTFEPPTQEPVSDAAPCARESTTFRLKPDATGAEVETARTRRRSARTKFQDSFKYEGRSLDRAPSARCRRSNLTN